MKAGFRIGGAGLLAAGLLAGQAFVAGAGETEPAPEQQKSVCKKDGDGAGECKGKHEQARAQHQEKMKEHMEAQQKARRELMEAVQAEEDAQKALAMIRAHRVKQHAEMTAFHEAQMAERKAEMTARYEAMLAELDALAAKADLTKEDIRAALREGCRKQGGKGPEGMEKKRMHKGKKQQGGSDEAPAPDA